MNSTLSKILGNSLKTVSNWKKEKRLIIDLLEKYFNKEDLEEFIEKNKVSKYDFVNEYSFVSCINFSEKLKILKTEYKQNLNAYQYDYFLYFTNFILDYIKNGYQNEDKQWKGTNQLHFFQNYFLDFCINNQPNANSLNPFNAIDFIYNQDAIKPQYIDLEFNTTNTLRELSNFINNFKQENLYFLNLCIQDNFISLLNFYKSNDANISNLKADILYFLNNLKTSLEKVLNIKIDSIENIGTYIIQYKESVK
ncbi:MULTISPECIES: hypothetical protein [Aliarcobacter]|uniref:hypothetical protein n=1 Tax=Aliarcobacter TaxID=2321111 RepID=UPI0021B29DB7|nr:hypothetical protein [Aliarcobacter butzleri]MCT7588981.1 hypothetical protein [Aliarcobacter butzleri]MCT7628927.1 hypothetical protein [Aliarcobacter butzleri]